MSVWLVPMRVLQMPLVPIQQDRTHARAQTDLVVMVWCAPTSMSALRITEAAVPKRAALTRLGVSPAPVTLGSMAMASRVETPTSVLKIMEAAL
jgi:hypothetical protein